MTRESIVWAAAGVALALLTFIGGRELGSEGDRVSAFDTTAVPYAGADLPAAFTRGGFSGFGEGGLDGRTTISGRIRGFENGNLALDTATGLQTVRLTGDRVIRVFEAGDRAGTVQVGNNVVVLLRPNGDQAASVLLLVD